MYRKHFGLKKTPFSIAPDPRYLYMSRQHKEALAHLLYGLQSDGGFVLLTGDVGTGKTTICRRLLERLTKKCIVAFIIHPTLSVGELLATVCDEFRISYPKKAGVKELVDRLNAFLLEAHADRKKAILIIDEAQNLSREVLEQIRLLTNLETNERKLLQIILIGQPELRDKLARPEMKQLAQRIIARCHLGPLSKTEVAAYVSFRLSIAGTNAELFSPGSLKQLYRASGGIPRVMNTICDRALLGAYVQRLPSVDKATLLKAAREVLGLQPEEGGSKRKKAELAAAFVVLLAAALLMYQLVRFYPFHSETSEVNSSTVMEEKADSDATARQSDVEGVEAGAGEPQGAEAPSTMTEKEPDRTGSH